jgi:peroxiredoxin Q/BCP
MPEKTAALDRKVPDFSLPATGGATWKLSAARGRKLVLYFYPKDNTSGCTQEGIAFADCTARSARRAPRSWAYRPIRSSHEKFKSKWAS